MVSDMSTPTTAGARLLAARENSGLSLTEARDYLVRTVPARYLPSVSKLSRMENDLIPERKWDGIVIYALSKAYGCRIGDISEMVAAEYESLNTLVVSASPWITTPTSPDQMKLDLAAA